MNCPRCNSNEFIKNGTIHNGKPKFECKKCKRQFINNPQNAIISKEKIKLIDKLLLEKIPLVGISRTLDISEVWLQKYINLKFESIEREVKITNKEKGKLIIQCDELWSFVGNKDNKYWVWLALDVNTREIVGCFVGNRSKEGAQGLWDSLPAVYRQCAVCYTDFWSAYEGIFPLKRHKPVGKESGKTSYIERFNLTLRQRISRLVRKTLSFSKKLENHIGAIWYFIHDYNSNLACQPLHV